MSISKQSLAEQFVQFISGLLDASHWPARWYCGKWTDFHGWLYIISDLMIWAAYFAIPFLLFKVVTKRRDFPFLKIFILFIAFILLCGLTHLMDAIIFWWPAYRLSALIRFLAGVVSLFTVFALYKVLPLIYTLRTSSQLEAEIEQRKRAEDEVQLQMLEIQKARELLQVKDDFINMASHELKTPLTSLKGYLHILKLKAAEQWEPGLEHIDKAATQTTKITKLIDDLFNVSKMQMGLQTIIKSPFLLKDLILECKENFEVAGSKEIVCTELSDVVVTADRERIKQVLNNLIDNAFKYSPGKGYIVVSNELKDSSIKVMVQDFGQGIENDKIPHIFERYYRVEHTSKFYAGMGLGLYICSDLISRHGGTIGVESIQGVGSTFWFELPLIQQD